MVAGMFKIKDDLFSVSKCHKSNLKCQRNHATFGKPWRSNASNHEAEKNDDTGSAFNDL